MLRSDGSRPISDRVRLLHMVEAARQAMSFANGRVREDFDTDPMLRRAVVHAIQEIGEAASRVTEEGRARAPALPWKQIVGMRHRMVHVYYDIDTDAVWEVVQRDLAGLIVTLDAALSAWPAESNT